MRRAWAVPLLAGGLLAGSPVAAEEPQYVSPSGRQYFAQKGDPKPVVDALVALGDAYAGLWNHRMALGVLRFVSGEFDAAAEAFEKNVALAEKVETSIGGLDWLYMSYRRAGRADKARAVLDRVTPDLVIEGNTRLYFNRMLFYKGLKTEAALFGGQLSELERATLAFGVGNWHLVNGDAGKARPYFEQVVSSSAWPALAFIAAERELARAAR